MKTVLIIGGTGAQGIPVVKALTNDSAYAVRVLTRDTSSSAAKELAALPNVVLVKGDTYNESDLRDAFKGVQLAFVNTNGFAIGEKSEIYWGMRIYELARQAGIGHYVWGGLDYMTKLGSYDPTFRCGHYDGKGKVTEWLLTQPKSPMAVSILTSGPYIEMLSEFMMPEKEGDTYVFSAPLGTGHVPYIHLDDLGLYARWIFDHPGRSNGMDLQVATEHVGFDYLAKTFTEVTGKPATYRPLTPDEYFGGVKFWNPDTKVASGLKDHSDATLQTFRQNFGGFWNTWAADNVKRDYKLLDEILPNRVKNVGEWMRKVGYTGDRRSVLKDIGDGEKKKQQQRQQQQQRLTRSILSHSRPLLQFLRRRVFIEDRNLLPLYHIPVQCRGSCEGKTKKAEMHERRTDTQPRRLLVQRESANAKVHSITFPTSAACVAKEECDPLVSQNFRPLSQSFRKQLLTGNRKSKNNDTLLAHAYAMV